MTTYDPDREHEKRDDENNIPFPYPPYPQQVDLMKAIYQTVDNSLTGYFESPTGTGKSLSLICSALHWQRIQEKKILEEQELSRSSTSASSSSSNTTQSKKEDDWLTEWQNSYISQSDAAKEKQRAAEKHKDMIKRVAMHALIKPGLEGEGVPRFRGLGYTAATSSSSSSSTISSNANSSNNKISNSTDVADDVAEFALPHYDSGDEEIQRKVKKSKSRKEKITNKLHKNSASGAENKDFGSNNNHGDVNDDDDSDDDSEDGEDDESGMEALKLPQIIYCSRTHTQIAQFVNEIRRTQFSDVRCVTLGSRRNMCINHDLRKLYTSDSKISEKCLEMQRNKSKKSTVKHEMKNGNGLSAQRGQKIDTSTASCPYHNQRAEQRCSDHILSQVRDIEELNTLGKQTKACPYYATRKAISSAQVICMPYNVLLHEDLRSSMGINLNGRVIVFDEAHNLVEAVNHTYSAEVNLDQLNVAMQGIDGYLNRFQTILSGKNVYYITLLNSVLKCLHTCLSAATSQPISTTAAPNMYAKEDVNPQLTHPLSTVSSSFSSIERPSSSNKRSKSPVMSPAHKSSKTSLSSSATIQSTEIHSVNDFIFYSRLDNINFFKLRRHMTETHLVNRIGGFAESLIKLAQANALLAAKSSSSSSSSSSSCSGKKSCGAGCGDESTWSSKLDGKGPQVGVLDDEEEGGMNSSPDRPNCTSALRSVLTLLSCLTNADKDGRVVISCPPVSSTAAASVPTIKFLLLNPHVHFKKIVEQARSVILLGGTMQPFSYFTSFLFSHIQQPATKIKTFSCGHVIHRSSVKALIVSSGPTGKTLEFTHEKRMSKETIMELFSTLLRTCSVIPNGIVVFFTSYSYLDCLLDRWRETGLLRELQGVRPVFIEPRSAHESEKVWNAYSESALDTNFNAKGAILFCVIGGKLSEGINFSDNLARGVVVVGLPYPDRRDPILQEKLKFADIKESGSGNRLYEAMCMKAVNQSIGRSIRHIGDYATILLLDRRYTNQRVINQLPAWMRESTMCCSTFGEAQAELTQFFLKKKREKELTSHLTF